MLGLKTHGWAARGRWSRCGAVCFGLLASLAATVAGAGSFPPSETVFPATTKAWISIPDSRGFGDAFKRSKYGQLVNDPAMKPFVESFRKQLSASGGKRLANLGLTTEDLEKIGRVHV